MASMLAGPGRRRRRGRGRQPRTNIHSVDRAAGCRARPRPRCLADRPGPHPATTPPGACPWPPRARLRLPERRSFLYAPQGLACPVADAGAGPTRAGKPNARADAALGQHDTEPPFDPGREILPAPPAILGEIRSGANPSRHFLLLLGLELWYAARRLAIGQSPQPFGIVAVNPVAQRLTAATPPSEGVLPAPKPASAGPRQCFPPVARDNADHSRSDPVA